MRHSRETVSLTEEDYDAILDVITKLLSQTSTRTLTGLFRSHIIPLLDASTCFYAWADPDVFKARIIDAVGIPESDFPTIQGHFPLCPLARHMVDHQSLVAAYDLDLPRRKLQDSVTKFFEAHPAGRFRGSSYLDDIRTTLLTINRSEPAIVIGFHRLDACRKSFTRREKRILEFLSPHLCQAIKTLVVDDSLNNRVATTEENPSKSHPPMVQVTRDSRIVDQNPGFRKLFHSHPGDTLGSSLTRFLERGIRDYEKSPNARISEPESFWYCLCPRVFEVDITRRSDDLWRMELHPMSDACPGSNPILKHYGLTPKEKEVCCRVRQGFDNREVASQLFISFHTAKTHLKNIYRKLDIQNRPRLVSFLNKNP